MVSHPLRMRKALGSNPSVSICYSFIRQYFRTYFVLVRTASLLRALEFRKSRSLRQAISLLWRRRMAASACMCVFCGPSLSLASSAPTFARQPKGVYFSRSCFRLRCAKPGHAVSSYHANAMCRFSSTVVLILVKSALAVRRVPD